VFASGKRAWRYCADRKSTSDRFMSGRVLQLQWKGRIDIADRGELDHERRAMAWILAALVVAATASAIPRTAIRVLTKWSLRHFHLNLRLEKKWS
jgi:hypothetical protein